MANEREVTIAIKLDDKGFKDLNQAIKETEQKGNQMKLRIDNKDFYYSILNSKKQVEDLNKMIKEDKTIKIGAEVDKRLIPTLKQMNNNLAQLRAQLEAVQESNFYKVTRGLISIMDLSYRVVRGVRLINSAYAAFRTGDPVKGGIGLFDTKRWKALFEWLGFARSDVIALQRETGKAQTAFGKMHQAMEGSKKVKENVQEIKNSQRLMELQQKLLQQQNEFKLLRGSRGVSPVDLQQVQQALNKTKELILNTQKLGKVAETERSRKYMESSTKQAEELMNISGRVISNYAKMGKGKLDLGIDPTLSSTDQLNLRMKQFIENQEKMTSKTFMDKLAAWSERNYYINEQFKSLVSMGSRLWKVITDLGLAFEKTGYAIGVIGHFFDNTSSKAGLMGNAIQVVLNYVNLFMRRMQKGHTKGMGVIEAPLPKYSPPSIVPHGLGGGAPPIDIQAQINKLSTTIFSTSQNFQKSLSDHAHQILTKINEYIITVHNKLLQLHKAQESGKGIIGGKSPENLFLKKLIELDKHIIDRGKKQGSDPEGYRLKKELWDLFVAKEKASGRSMEQILAQFGGIRDKDKGYPDSWVKFIQDQRKNINEELKNKIEQREAIKKERVEGGGDVVNLLRLIQKGVWIISQLMRTAIQLLTRIAAFNQLQYQTPGKKPSYIEEIKPTRREKPKEEEKVTKGPVRKIGEVQATADEKFLKTFIATKGDWLKQTGIGTITPKKLEDPAVIEKIKQRYIELDKAIEIYARRLGAATNNEEKREAAVRKRQYEDERASWGLRLIQAGQTPGKPPSKKISGGLLDTLTETSTNLISDFGLALGKLKYGKGQKASPEQLSKEYGADIAKVVKDLDLKVYVKPKLSPEEAAKLRKEMADIEKTINRMEGLKPSEKTKAFADPTQLNEYLRAKFRQEQISARIGKTEAKSNKEIVIGGDLELNKLNRKIAMYHEIGHAISDAQMRAKGFSEVEIAISYETNKIAKEIEAWNLAKQFIKGKEEAKEFDETMKRALATYGYLGKAAIGDSKKKKPIIVGLDKNKVAKDIQDTENLAKKKPIIVGVKKDKAKEDLKDLNRIIDELAAKPKEIKMSVPHKKIAQQTKVALDAAGNISKDPRYFLGIKVNEERLKVHIGGVLRKILLLQGSSAKTRIVMPLALSGVVATENKIKSFFKNIQKNATIKMIFDFGKGMLTKGKAALEQTAIGRSMLTTGQKATDFGKSFAESYVGDPKGLGKINMVRKQIMSFLGDVVGGSTILKIFSLATGNVYIALGTLALGFAAVIAAIQTFIITMATVGAIIMSTIATIAAATIAITGLVIAFAAAIPIISKSLSAFKETDEANHKLISTMKSMGFATKENFDSLSKYARELQDLSGISENEFKKTMAVLGTFYLHSSQKTIDTMKKMGKDIDPLGNLKEATKAAANITLLTGGDMVSNSKAIGKALQEPLEFYTALRRQGTIVDKESLMNLGRMEQQLKNETKEIEKQISTKKGLTKEEKDLYVKEAQRQFILKELNQEYGHQLNRVKTLGGATAVFGAVMQNIFSDIGKGVWQFLKPIGTVLLTALKGVRDYVGDLGKSLAPAFSGIGSFLSEKLLVVVDVFKGVFKTISESNELQAFLGTVKTILEEVLNFINEKFSGDGLKGIATFFTEIIKYGLTFYNYMISWFREMYPPIVRIFQILYEAVLKFFGIGSLTEEGLGAKLQGITEQITFMMPQIVRLTYLFGDWLRDTAIPWLGSVKEYFLGMVQDLIDFWDKTDRTKNAFQQFGEAAMKIGKAFISLGKIMYYVIYYASGYFIISKIINLYAQLQQHLQGMGVVGQSLSYALETLKYNLLGIAKIIAGVLINLLPGGPLISPILIVWGYMDTIKGQLKLWSPIIRGIRQAWEYFTSKLIGGTEGALTPLQQIWQIIKSITIPLNEVTLWGGLVVDIFQNFGKYSEVFAPAIQNLKEMGDLIAELAGYLWTFVSEALKTLVAPFALSIAIITGMWVGLGRMIYEYIVTPFGEALAWIINEISITWTAFIEASIAVFGLIKATASELWQDISIDASSVWESITETIGTYWDDLMTWMFGTTQETTNVIMLEFDESMSSSTQKAMSKWSSAIEWIKNAWSRGIAWIKDGLSKLWDGIKNLATQIDAWYPGIKRAATALWDMGKPLADLVRKAKDFAKNIWEGLKNARRLKMEGEIVSGPAGEVAQSILSGKAPDLTSYFKKEEDDLGKDNNAGTEPAKKDKQSGSKQDKTPTEAEKREQAVKEYESTFEKEMKRLNELYEKEYTMEKERQDNLYAVNKLGIEKRMALLDLEKKRTKSFGDIMGMFIGLNFSAIKAKHDLNREMINADIKNQQRIIEQEKKGVELRNQMIKQIDNLKMQELASLKKYYTEELKLTEADLNTAERDFTKEVDLYNNYLKTVDALNANHDKKQEKTLKKSMEHAKKEWKEQEKHNKERHENVKKYNKAVEDITEKTTARQKELGKEQIAAQQTILTAEKEILLQKKKMEDEFYAEREEKYGRFIDQTKSMIEKTSSYMLDLLKNTGKSFSEFLVDMFWDIVSFFERMIVAVIAKAIVDLIFGKPDTGIKAGAAVGQIMTLIAMGPPLAKGGVGDTEMYARLFEKGKPEAVLPLTDNRAMEKIRTAILGVNKPVYDIGKIEKSKQDMINNYRSQSSKSESNEQHIHFHHPQLISDDENSLRKLSRHIKKNQEKAARRYK